MVGHQTRYKKIRCHLRGECSSTRTSNICHSLIESNIGMVFEFHQSDIISGFQSSYKNPLDPRTQMKNKNAELRYDTGNYQGPKSDPGQKNMWLIDWIMPNALVYSKPSTMIS